MRINIAALLLGLLAPFLAPNNSHAVPLLGNLPGATTFGDLVMLRNDDESSHRINLPLEVDFYGNRYDSFFVNHNGNGSFNGLISAYTPNAFPITDQPMIAPYWVMLIRAREMLTLPGLETMCTSRRLIPTRWSSPGTM